MTDREKIREFLVGMADAVDCDYSTERDIRNVILPYIDSMQKEPVSEDYKKARKDAIFSINETKGYSFKLQDMFDAGANWQKKQMMKDAMLCVLGWYDGFILEFTQEQLNEVVENLKLEVGDKVKLIIIKED